MKKTNTLLIALASMALGASATAQGAGLADSYLMLFKPLPTEVPSPDNELTEDKIALGRMLYFDKRFLQEPRRFLQLLPQRGGLWHGPTHPTPKGTKDNAVAAAPRRFTTPPFTSPSSGMVVRLPWKSRAKGPPLNPIEMAMAGKEAVEKVLNSIPGYVESFKKAFPGEASPVSYDNFGKAIGAFERKLLTPARWDKFLKGDQEALTEAEKKGFEAFATAGCATCHNGVGVGGHLYQKLGLVKAWPELKDAGRFEATKKEEDKFFFKVPLPAQHQRDWPLPPRWLRHRPAYDGQDDG